jgi:hypothetical protein
MHAQGTAGAPETSRVVRKKRMNSSRRRPVQLFARALPFKVGKGSRARVSRRGLFKRSQRAPSRKRPVRGRREEARDISWEHGKALGSVVTNCEECLASVRRFGRPEIATITRLA